MIARTVKVRLLDVAHARSGDKGDTANVGLIALEPRWYELLERHVTLSLKTDAQGKVYSTALLRMVLDVPGDEATRLGLPSHGG